MRNKNLVVAQSGGPTPVINASLRGVIETCLDMPDVFDKIYAGYHGIEGVLREELLDLSAQSRDEIALLSVTPSAGSIGSCRYKLKAHQTEDFTRVVDVLKAHNVGYFLYNGGNDSMDTANKISQLAHEQGLDLVAVGIPKTIDNDIGDSEFKLIDHTPGYGSVARYWSGMVQGALEENRGSSPADPVLVLQAMGRLIGYIPAAARLADPDRQEPLLIYMAESGLTVEVIYEQINDMLKAHGHCVVVVSEGLKLGELGEVRDSFGHVQFSSSKTTVASQLVNYLNERGLCVPGAARGNVSGTHQRHDIAYASIVDLAEAYAVGQKAAVLAAEGESGYMSTILREPGPIYSVRYDKVPLELVANSERTFPQEWLTEARNDVTDDFLAYARPLIGEDWPSVPLVDGRMRFTRFEPIYADQVLPAYEPQEKR